MEKTKFDSIISEAKPYILEKIANKGGIEFINEEQVEKVIIRYVKKMLKKYGFYDFLINIMVFSYGKAQIGKKVEYVHYTSHIDVIYNKTHYYSYIDIYDNDSSYEYE